MILVKDLRTGKTAQLLSVHDRAFGLLVDERQVSFYRPLQELEFLTPDPSLNQGGDPAVGPSAPLEVVSHGVEDDADRPLTALAVYWIGSIEPLHAVEGDFWLTPSPQSGTAGVLSLFTDGAFGPLGAGGGGGGGATNLSVTNRTATALTVASDTGNDAVLPLADGTRAGLLSAAEQVKLAGVATGATANASNADLRDRSTHTGTQGAGTITGLAAVATSGAYDDLSGRPTLGTAAATAAADYAAAAHVGSGAGAHANAVANSAAGFISGASQAKLDSVATGATANASDAALRDRATHTGAQQASTISDFISAVRAEVEAALLQGANVTITPAGSGATRTLSLASTAAGGVSDGDKGDITVSASGATWTIDNGAITLAKQANLANQRLVARNTAGAGVPEEVSLSQLLDWASNTRGSLLFRGASGWVSLPPGTVGQTLQTGGAGADPSWFTPTGGGNAQTANPLSQFASTISDQLRGVISDETGTGALVFADGPALIAPTVSTNATVTAGTNAQGQAPLTADVNVITTTAASPSGVTLPTATAGLRVMVINRGSNAVACFPASGAAIDTLAADSSLQVNTNAIVTFTAVSTTSWQSSRTERTDISFVIGLGANVAAFLGTPTSANLRAALTDETGTGLAYFQGGDAGTPSAIVLTNGTGLPWAAGVTGKPTSLSGYGITDAQPLDSDLTSIAALTTTSFGRSFLDRVDAAAGRTHLGLQSLATQSALGNITSAGAIGSTANLPVITTTSGVLTTGAFGTAANQFAQGNDARFEFYMPIALSDVSTAVTAGNGKEEFTVERAFTLHVIPRFTASTAPTGSIFLFDVNKNGTTIFDTRPQIDISGTRSISAATQAVLTGDSASFAIGDVIRFDFDQVGSTIAGAGIKAHLFGRWT